MTEVQKPKDRLIRTLTDVTQTQQQTCPANGGKWCHTERIEERKREVAKHANVTAAQIIGATALRAFATIDDAFDENGDFSITKARDRRNSFNQENVPQAYQRRN